MVTVDLLVSRAATSSYIENLTRQLGDEARLLAVAHGSSLAAIEQKEAVALARAAGARFTLVAPDGRVVADSEARPEKMENHRDRPEVAAALAARQGSSIRHSPTIGTDFLYVAVPAGSNALRLAVPLSEVARQVNAIRRRMLVSVALAFLPALLLAAVFARYTSHKLGRIMGYAAELAQGNFRARLGPAGGGELGMLARRLAETGDNLRRTAEALEREHAELEKLERVRRDFVMNVSHELRTPLASIQGYTETLLDGALSDPDNNERFLLIIRQNAERLARLSADLITLTQIELKTRAFDLHLRPVNALLEEAADTMRPMAEKKSLSLAVEPVSGDAVVYCDYEATFQILTNLLDNAVKYTPEGGNIVVGARALNGLIEVSVRDSGIGIPGEDLPRLFERFYRVDKARSRELGGTGLGLAIVKHLVRAQGGEVRVESEPGRGSVFSFTLPTGQREVTDS